MYSKNFKKYILCTVFITTFYSYGAQSASVVISTNTPGPIVVGNTDTVTVTSTGAVTSGGVTYTDVSAGFFNNQGSVASFNGNALEFTTTFGSTSLSGGITNSGTIGSNNGTAVLIENGTTINDGLSNNGGMISNNNGVGILMQNGAIFNGGINNDTNGAISSINNYAILIQNSTNFNGGITNSATISSNGTSAIVIQNGSTVNGGITNSGSITTNNNYAIFVQSGGRIFDGITNTGTISGITIENGGQLDGDLLNDSTIQGNQHGVKIADGSQLYGNIVNNELIQGNGGHGILVANGVSGNGTITNNKTITGSLSGLRIYDTNAIDGITNTANSTITGSAEEGIYIGNGSISNGVTNNGIITGSTDGAALTSHGTLNHITNTGTIEGLAGNGLRVFSGTRTAILLNSGTIKGNLNGILYETGGAIDGLFTNNGSIIGTTGAGIRLNSSSSVNNDIINNNTITGNTDGIRINFTGFGADIVNNGTITGTTGAAINLEQLGFSGAIINNGTLTGSKGIYLNNGIVTGGIYNNVGGTITGTGGTAIEIGFSGNQYIYLNGGNIIGDVIDTQVSSTSTFVQVDQDFTAQGNFNVANFIISSGKTMNTAGNSLNALTLDNQGTLHIGSGGTATFETIQASAGNNYIFGINGDNAGKLVLTTGALDLTNSTISIYSTGSMSTTPLMIVDTVNPLTGGPSGTPLSVSSNSYLWTYTIVDGTAVGGDDTDLYVQATANPSNSLSSGNNENLLNALDSISTADPQLSAIQAAVNNAPDADTLNNILSSTLPNVSYAAVTSVNNVAFNTIDLVNTRLGDLSSTSNTRSGISSGDIVKGLHLWAQVFGQRGNQGIRSDNNGTFSGYDVNTYGTTIGLDSDALINNSTVGASFTYAKSDVNALTNADMVIDSYQLSLYGQHDLNNKAFLRGIASYAYNDISTTRFNIGGTGSAAFGDYNADQISGTLTAGREYAVNAGVLGIPVITPSVMTNYIHYMPNSYTETGAGGANLSVNGDNMNLLEFGVNLQSRWDLMMARGAVLQPTVNVGYRYDVIGDNLQTTSSFTGGGASFSTQGINPAQSTLNGGVGLTYQKTDHVSFTAGYNYEHKSNYNAHAGIIKMNYKF